MGAKDLSCPLFYHGPVLSTVVCPLFSEISRVLSLIDCPLLKKLRVLYTKFFFKGHRKIVSTHVPYFLRNFQYSRPLNCPLFLGL